MFREKIVHIETGNEDYREYTDSEIAEVERAQAEAAKLDAEAAAKEAARKAVFDKLGLTEEEAKLLLS